LIRFTELLEAEVRVEPAWKTNSAFGSPPPSRVSEPFSCIEDAEEYTPGVSVCPPPSGAETVVVEGAEARTP